MDKDDSILWLEAADGDSYVSDLSRLFGTDCRMAMNLENSLVVTRGRRVIAEAPLDQDDRITSVTVAEKPACMTQNEYFRAIETFMGRKVLYKQR